MDNAFLQALEREARQIEVLAGRDYATPGALAKAMDPTTVQTPALDIIDDALVDVDTAVEVMLRRRMLFAKYRDAGMSEHEARECSEIEVPTAGCDRLIISMPPQEGKQIAHSVPVPTPDGWRTHGELRTGDYVYHPSGRAVQVTATSAESTATMRVATSDGASIVCHENHEWTVYDRTRGTWRTMETRQLAARQLHTGPQGRRGGRYIFQLPFHDALDGRQTPLPMDPYTLGVWLGDGKTSSSTICHHADDIYELPYEVMNEYVQSGTGVVYTSYVGLWTDLKATGVAGNKHIPEAYLWADRQSRFDLLCGLIDTDGSIDTGGQVLFANANTLLASQTAQLIRSLGYRAGERVVAPRTSTSGVVGKQPIHIVTYSPHDGVAPARLARKVAKLKPSIRRRRVAITSVESCKPEPGRCITVDSDDGLYLVGDRFTPTHNSERATHYGALWMLRRHPQLRIAIVSYEERIAQRMSYLLRNDLETYDGSEGNFDVGLRLRKDNRSVGSWNLANDKGSVYAIGIGGALTGRPVDMLFIDDPVKDAKAADSSLLSDQAWQWWQSVARARLAPGAPTIVILTRWHEADMAGRLLSKQREDEASELQYFDRWRVINISAQADYRPELGETDPLGRQPGEFMISARGRTQAQWEATRAATSARIWTALYQGRPSPDSGDVFNRNWWMRYETPIWSHDEDGKCFVHDANEVIQSWDATFKNNKDSDFVVGQVWARKGANAYLVDQVRARMSYTETVAAVRRMTEKWPQAIAKLIEDTANGPAIINSLRTEIGGIIAVQVKGSKEARAKAISPMVESHNVWLPSPDIALYDVEALIEECTQFPNAAHDDQVDALSQSLARMFLHGAGGRAWLESLAPPCPDCGQPNPKEALACSKCGVELKQPTEELVEAQPEPFSLTSVIGNGSSLPPSNHVQAVQEAIRQFGPSSNWSPFR